MMTLAEKCRKAEEELAKAHGDFSLFMLVERPDLPGKWDVVAAAPWLGTERNDMQLIVDGLLPHLNQDDWRALARIAPLRPDGDFTRTINRRVPARHEIKEVSLGQINGANVNHAFVITSDADPVRPKELQAAAA